MKRVLYDTNVVLDALMQREPFYSTSTAAMDVENHGGKIEGYIAGYAVTTVDYVLRKQVGTARSRTAIAQLLEKIKVATVTKDLDSNLNLMALRLKPLVHLCFSHTPVS